MRVALMAVAFVMTAPVLAQIPPAQATVPAAAYNSATTDLGTLIDNPATKSVLDKYIPQMINNPQISMARSMTLKSLQQYAGEMLSDATLAKIDADLAKIPAK